MSGTYSVPATFTSLAAAINSVSATTPFGPITIEVAAGYIEKVPFGGYTLTAKGSAATPITFKRSGVGPNPLLIAFSGGTNTPATNFQDGVWQLRGCDYVTIDGIDILDTNSFNPATMEYGYGLLNASISGTNGCQYNTIKNCTITLNRINNTASSIWRDGSIGIEVMLSSVLTHSLTQQTNSAAGTNSFNKFYNNTIQNCNIGIVLLGSSQYYIDQFNDIGGSSILTGNKILNYGGAPLAVNKAAGILANYQENLNISFNLINNNNSLGVNHPNNLFGINSQITSFANSTIQSNTVTLNAAGATQSVVAILSDYGFPPLPTIGGALKVENNLITNCTYPTATSGSFYGIYNEATMQNTSISNNVLSNNSSACTSGTYCNIYSASGNGYITTNIFTVGINNNLISNVSLISGSTSVSFDGIICGASSISGTTYSASINSNSIQTVNYSGSASGPFNFIKGYGGSVVQPLKYLRVQNNQILNLNIPTTGSISLISAGYNIENNLISGNNIGSFTKSSSAGYVRGYYDFSSYSTSAPTSTTIVTGNNFSNITATGATNCSGIELAPPTPSVRTVFISTNTVSAISTGSMGTIYGILVKDPDSLSVINNNYVSGFNGWIVNGMIVGGFNSSTWKPVGIHSNTICSLVATNNISGLSFGQVRNSSAYKNKIYDLQCNGNGGVVGLSFGSTKGLTKVYNNLIGDLRAPFANNPIAITGINIGSGTDFGDIHEVFHNSININASSIGSNYGTCGVYHTGSTFTIGILDLKNNLVVNTSTANGTGLTVGLYRSPWSLQNYSTSSNNNLFYVGGTWVANKEYYDGSAWSSYSVALAFISPRESNSKIEFPPFQSTSGPSLNFLNLNNFTPTLAESGGLPGTGITTDIIGTIRNTTTPDIGAWEGNFMLPLGVTENKNINDEFVLYPNPNNGSFILESKSTQQIIITNVIGEEILKQETVKGKNKIDIQNQAAGIYFVKIISSENKKTVTAKVIKQ